MEKRILVYIGHPAQYHFFKHCLHRLQEHSHSIKILIKTKDILETLLKEDGVEYENIQCNIRKNNKASILLASFQRTLCVYRVARRFHADILIGTDSSIAQAGFLLGKPAITTLEDDVEIIKNLAKLTYPFTSAIVVPSVCRVGKWEKKKIPYYGYMKLAYLHPNYFVPDRDIVSSYGIEGKYILIRLAQLTAHHDVGIKGLSIQLVADIIQIAEKHGYKVYISSEKQLEVSLQAYRLQIKHTDIHHVMNFASLLISDSQSMSVEAAILGVPSLRFSDFSGRISVLEELEQKYHLTSGIKTSEADRLLSETERLLSNPNLRGEYQQHRQLMLKEKIDVTAFLAWFIENYPQSADIIKQSPDYQNKFR